MKTARLALLADFALAAAFAQAPQNYTYEYPTLLNPYTSSQWTSNGTNSVSTGMYTSSASTGGSLIFSPAIAAPSNCYEVHFKLNLASPSGNYMVYLRASSNALYKSGSTATGTFYAVEITNISNAQGYYTATLNYVKSVNGTLTTLGSDGFYPNGPGGGGVTDIRIVMIQGNAWDVYVNNVFWNSAYDSSSPITTGQPGVGVAAAPSSNGITAIDIGQLDTTAPNAVNTQLVGTSVFPNYVDIQFPAVLDQNVAPPGATGIAYYQFTRNGSWISLTGTPNFEDRSVQPGTSYAYTISACDFHANCANSTINITTPPAGAIDPREVGVRTTGTYWGSGGEQIDMRSGNLNFTVPLIKAMSRTGGGFAFNLSYNAQNWRQDPGGEWQLGRDIGYGYGWRLSAGALTPIYDSIWGLDHYEFTDSTGALYRLDQNNNGVWSSKESIYVYYDSNAGRLYFRDGSFWSFGCTSAGTEQDAGTMYPTAMYDSNGNYIGISYNAGAGVSYAYSSSRIGIIEDVRGNGTSDYSFTYTTFTGDSFPHLTGITNTIGTAEKYTFSYTAGPLTAPFTPATSYGSWRFLSSIANNIPLTTSFTYDTTGSGELDAVTFPYQGKIGWTYGPFNYSGTRTYREVQGRSLVMSSGATALNYGVSYQTDPGITFHTYSQVDDPDGNSEKAYFFDSTSGDAGFGLMNFFDFRPHHYPNTNGGHHDIYAWTTDSVGNPYISTDTATEDEGNPTQIVKQTTQTLDQYGNVTQMKIFDYGFGSTPMRTYTNTYLATSAYTSLYIFNRLLSSSVTDGTHTTTLVTNSYDQVVLTNVTGINEHYSGYGTSWTTRGNVTTSVTPAGTTLHNYDIAGNAIYTSMNGLVTTSTVSSTTNYTAPSAITTNTLSSSLGYTAALGVNSATGPNGDNLAIAYDANNRPHTTTAPTGAVTTYTYNDSSTPPNKIATTNGHWVQTNMDGFGRTIRSITGNGTTTVSTVDTVYVSCGCTPIGKVGQTSAPYAPGGAVYWTTNTYDGLGRTTQTELPDGSITHYSYSANTVTVSDPAAKTKTFTINALGKLTQVQEPDPTLGTVSTNYTYDMFDHLITVSMPRGSNTQTRTFNYLTGTTVGIDLLSATNPENGTVTYTYNSDHSLHTKTDAKGQVFTYSYDSYKRLTQVMVGTTVLRNFIYDTNTLDTTGYSGTYTQGRLVAVQNSAFTPQGYMAGQGGSNVTVPSNIQFIEMFDYAQSGLLLGKRLQVQETFHWYVNNVLQTSNQTINLDGAYTYDTGGEGKVLSVNYPYTWSFNGTNTVQNPGPTYTYSFDAMMRPTGLKDQNNNTLVNNVTYNAANQLLTFNTETHQYNNLNQMTRLTITGAQPLDISYNFPAGTNNGKISTQTDNLSAETVTYQYDSLNRLLSATSSQSWSETYGFDGFGNLLSKTGTGGAPTLSQSVTASSNHIVGQSYDSNGNQTSGPLGSISYDAENRVASVSSAGVQYAYDSRNKRIWSSTLSGGNLTQIFYYYGTDGQKLGIYPVTLAFLQNGTTPVMTDNTNVKLSTFFGHKRVGTYDRLGTAKYDQQNGGAMSFYPYGEDRGTVQPNDSLKFATYTRDSATGLDYADQRYYASNFGRFMTADPSRTSVGPRDPASWNRYSYTRSDPVNRYDPLGLQDEGPPQAPIFQVCPNGLIVFTSQPCDQGNAAAMAGGVILTQAFGEALVKAEQQVIAAAIAGAELLLAPGTKCSQFFTGPGVYNGTGQAMLQAYQQNGLIVPGMVYATSVGQVPYADTFGWFSSQNTGAVTNHVASLPLPGGNPGQMVNASIITINEFGFFFTGVSATGGAINTAANGMAGLDLQQIQELVILHELAHAAGLIPDDGGGTGASEANSQTIYNECFH